MNDNLKGFFVVCCFAIFGIGAVLIRYLIMIFPEILIKDRKKKIQICSKILQKSWQYFVSLLEFLKILKINRKETEQLKNIKNSIIVSTHPCFLDVLVLLSIIPYTTCFVADKLTKNPFFKGMVSLLFIPEASEIDEWEKTATDMLNMEFNLLIFPMGGRHKKDEQPKIRKGASLIAQKSSKNIIMIKLENSYEFLTRNQPIYQIQKEPVEYSFSYLGEINTSEMLIKYPDEVTFRQKVTDIIKKYLYQ